LHNKKLFNALDFENTPPSVANLPASLTINGITVTPTFVYKGKDATASSWPADAYGETLSIAGSGTVPTINDGSPLLGSNDDSVKFELGKCYQPADAIPGDVTTEDMLFEIVWRPYQTAATYHDTFCKANGAVNTKGWSFTDMAAATGLVFYINDGTNFSYIITNVTAGVWYHCLIYVDRSDVAATGISKGLNGTFTAGGTNNPSSVGSITSTGKLSIGGASAIGTNLSKSNVAYFAMYKQANWFAGGATNTTQWGTFTAERFARLQGLYPTKSVGTALPVSMARNSVAYLDKVEGSTSKLYQVGSNWIRSSARNDTASQLKKGLLIEAARTNYAWRSDLTSWVPDRTSIAATSLTGPDGAACTANVIHENGVNTWHLAYLYSVTTVNGSMVLSLFVKEMAASRKLSLKLNETTERSIRINPVTHAIEVSSGTTATGVDGPWYGDWYRYWFVTTTAAQASATITCTLLDSGNNEVFQGLDQDTVGIWGVQLEAGTYPLSVIRTAGTAITTSADSLYWSGASNVRENRGTLEAKVLFPARDLATDKTILTLSDGGSSTERITLDVLATGDTAGLTIVDGSAQAAIVGTTDVVDGDVHTVRGTWQTNQAVLRVDSVEEGTPDISCTIPTELDRITVDASGGLVSDIVIFERKTTRSS
jgi:hypothetical protein